MTKDFYCWKPPPPGYLKLNVNGAMFCDLYRAGVGAIHRDDKGDIVMAASKVENEVDDPEAIELLAMLRGLKLCANMAIHKLIVESDCLLIMGALQEEAASTAMLDALLSETNKLPTIVW